MKKLTLALLLAGGFTAASLGFKAYQHFTPKENICERTQRLIITYAKSVGGDYQILEYHFFPEDKSLYLQEDFEHGTKLTDFYCDGTVDEITVNVLSKNPTIHKRGQERTENKFKKADQILHYYLNGDKSSILKELKQKD